MTRNIRSNSDYRLSQHSDCRTAAVGVRSGNSAYRMQMVLSDVHFPGVSRHKPDVGEMSVV